jgi:hypothetical protein
MCIAGGDSIKEGGTSFTCEVQYWNYMEECRVTKFSLNSSAYEITVKTM